MHVVPRSRIVKAVQLGVYHQAMEALPGPQWARAGASAGLVHLVGHRVKKEGEGGMSDMTSP